MNKADGLDSDLFAFATGEILADNVAKNKKDKKKQNLLKKKKHNFDFWSR